MSYELYLGDWLELAAEIPDNSIDSIITDPPYGTTQLEWDTAPDLKRMFQEFKRIAKPYAPMVIFSAQPFTTDLINAGREIFRYSLVAPKTTQTGHLDAKRKPLRNHEDISIFSVSGYGTYNPQMSKGHKVYTTYRSGEGSGIYSKQKRVASDNKGERYPTTVLNPQSFQKPDNFHPTQKPLDLLTYLVKTYSNPGETVFDPFSGSGTTAHACLLTDRKFIGAELSPEYHAKAIKRLEAVMAQPRLEFA